MEVVVPFPVPVAADSVLPPQVHYGAAAYNDPVTGIYFVTADDQHGRVTFENLDALKVCRGEALPYAYDWGAHQRGTWVYRVEQSAWLRERYTYEHRHYGSSYEFNGRVEEMLTDFHHYLFAFHDQFVEVLARGLWVEQAAYSLFQQPLQAGHPLLALPENVAERVAAYGLVSEVRINPLPTEQVLADARFCSQKLLQAAVVLDGQASLTHTLQLAYHSGQLQSKLQGYWGEVLATWEGVATLADVVPHLEKYLGEVSKRRRASGRP